MRLQNHWGMIWRWKTDKALRLPLMHGMRDDKVTANIKLQYV